jgi:hypothetical protein
MEEPKSKSKEPKPILENREPYGYGRGRGFGRDYGRENVRDHVFGRDHGRDRVFGRDRGFMWGQRQYQGRIITQNKDIQNCQKCTCTMCRPTIEFKKTSTKKSIKRSSKSNKSTKSVKADV